MSALKKTYYFSLAFLVFFMFSCSSPHSYKEINIGCILPFPNRGDSFGLEVKKALVLAVEEYNKTKLSNEPKVNLIVKNGKWSRSKKQIDDLYFDLKNNYKTDIIYLISNTGTSFLSDAFYHTNSQTILINPLYQYGGIDGLHRNIFSISPLLVDTNNDISNYIKKEKLKNVRIIQTRNDTWSQSSHSVQSLLAEEGITSTIEVLSEKIYSDSIVQTKMYKDKSDAIVFFGNYSCYKMLKELRKYDLSKPVFFGNNLIRFRGLDKDELVDLGNTKFTYFSPSDGNLSLAEDFLKKYKTKYKEDSKLQWVAMQSYDAINIILSKIKTINNGNIEIENFVPWLRGELYSLKKFKGVSGNISITESGGTTGISYSLYNITPNGEFIKSKD
ncbi:ABC transporter substrate-binding protein [Flavobacteriaceae bacterium]|nr:ABC transporter substrate-binding protein [Flavobacteriaceae bacterium]